MEHAVPGNAGIVDENFNRTQLGLDLFDAFLAGIVTGDIPLVGLDARGIGKGLGLFVIARIGRGHLVSGIAKCERYRLADASRSTRHQCNSCHKSLPPFGLSEGPARFL